MDNLTGHGPINLKAWKPKQEKKDCLCLTFSIFNIEHILFLNKSFLVIWYYFVADLLGFLNILGGSRNSSPINFTAKERECGQLDWTICFLSRVTWFLFAHPFFWRTNYFSEWKMKRLSGGYCQIRLCFCTFIWWIRVFLLSKATWQYHCSIPIIHFNEILKCLYIIFITIFLHG